MIDELSCNQARMSRDLCVYAFCGYLAKIRGLMLGLHMCDNWCDSGANEFGIYRCDQALVRLVFNDCDRSATVVQQKNDISTTVMR